MSYEPHPIRPPQSTLLDAPRQNRREIERLRDEVAALRRALLALEQRITQADPPTPCSCHYYGGGQVHFDGCLHAPPLEER